jgi:hypothetical protein
MLSATTRKSAESGSDHSGREAELRQTDEGEWQGIRGLDLGEPNLGHEHGLRAALDHHDAPQVRVPALSGPVEEPMKPRLACPIRVGTVVWDFPLAPKQWHVTVLPKLRHHSLYGRHVAPHPIILAPYKTKSTEVREREANEIFGQSLVRAVHRSPEIAEFQWHPGNRY